MRMRKEKKKPSICYYPTDPRASIAVSQSVPLHRFIVKFAFQFNSTRWCVLLFTLIQLIVYCFACALCSLPLAVGMCVFVFVFVFLFVVAAFVFIPERFYDSVKLAIVKGPQPKGAPHSSNSFMYLIFTFTLMFRKCYVSVMMVIGITLNRNDICSQSTSFRLNHLIVISK